MPWWPWRCLHRLSSVTEQMTKSMIRRALAPFADTLKTHQTKRTDFRSQRRRSADFTTRRPQVDDLDFVRVLRTSHQLSATAAAQEKMVRTSFGAMIQSRGAWCGG